MPLCVIYINPLNKGGTSPSQAQQGGYSLQLGDPSPRPTSLRTGVAQNEGNLPRCPDKVEGYLLPSKRRPTIKAIL